MLSYIKVCHIHLPQTKYLCMRENAMMLRYQDFSRKAASSLTITIYSVLSTYSKEKHLSNKMCWMHFHAPTLSGHTHQNLKAHLYTEACFCGWNVLRRMGRLCTLLFRKVSEMLLTY